MPSIERERERWCSWRCCYVYWQRQPQRRDPPRPVINPLTSEAQETITLKLFSFAGFISIDCGLDSTNPYNDADKRLPFSPDAPYTSAGVNREISREANVTGLKPYCKTLRSFPEGTRNCYTLGPVNIGAKYRVHAHFFYGNYDGLQRPPTFDIYLGVNRWTTVSAGEFARTEIIALVVADSVDVCLVKTGLGIPFISELDLRPLPFFMLMQDEGSRPSHPINETRSPVDGAVGLIRNGV